MIWEIDTTIIMELTVWKATWRLVSKICCKCSANAHPYWKGHHTQKATDSILRHHGCFGCVGKTFILFDVIVEGNPWQPASHFAEKYFRFFGCI